MKAVISSARSGRLMAAVSLAALLGAMAALPGPALAQSTAVPGTPTEGQNRYGDFRDQQGHGRTGDIREDVQKLGHEIKEGATSAVEGVENMVSGDKDEDQAASRPERSRQARRSGRTSEKALEAQRACARSDLDAATMRDLQRQLNEVWGTNGPRPGDADGICGPQTVASIKAFQAANGLHVDGVPSRDLLDRVHDVAQGPAGGPGTPGTSAATTSTRTQPERGSSTSAPGTTSPGTTTEGPTIAPATVGASPGSPPVETSGDRTGAVANPETSNPPPVPPPAATGGAGTAAGAQGAGTGETGARATGAGPAGGTMTSPASETSVPGSPGNAAPAPGTTGQATMPGQPVTPTTPSAPASPLPTTTDPATGQPR